MYCSQALTAESFDIYSRSIALSNFESEIRSPSPRRLCSAQANPFHENCLHNSIPQCRGGRRSAQVILERGVHSLFVHAGQHAVVHQAAFTSPLSASAGRRLTASRERRGK